jgi:NitT/TauT family transport system substrate-binding protein
MRVTVVEAFRSLFYAPQFVALHRGDFAEEGLEVTVHTGGGGTSTTRALIEGTAEIGLSGLMRSLDLADRGGRRLPHFAEVNSRNGFFLLSREPRPGFQWSDLVGRTVISFAGAPTPYCCMVHVLRRHRVDPAAVTFVRDLHGAEAVRAFREGRGDFLEAGQPATELLLDEGAHLVASMGDATGPLAFSSYMTTPERLRRDADLLVRFTRALYRAQRWMAAQDAPAIARVIAPAFPDVPERLGARVVDRYLRQGTWARAPIIVRSGFEHLQDVLVAAGFIRRRHRYADLVDTGIVRSALETMKAEAQRA